MHPYLCTLAITLVAGLVMFTPTVPCPAASITNLAGTGEAKTEGDGGPAAKAAVNNPFGVARAPDGSLWFCEYDGHRIRRIARDGTITTVAGTGKAGFGGDGGPAKDAQLNQPHELHFDARGNAYITDMRNNAVRRISATTQNIMTIAGGGEAGYAGDGGPAGASKLNQPHALQFGPDGALYICDTGNHVIRRADPKTGIITTFAGMGKAGNTVDGAKFTETPLKGPRAMDFDKDGNLWLATREGNQVFKLDLKAGTIHHIAGTGAKGFTGNGGPAKAATLSGPKGLAIAPNGNVYLADTESHSIRMIDVKKGTIELVAGTGAKGDGPEGNPLECKMGRPHGVFVEADGSLLIGDSEAHRVRVLR